MSPRGRRYQNRPADIGPLLALCLLWLVFAPALLFAELLGSAPLWWVAGLAAGGMVVIVVATT